MAINIKWQDGQPYSEGDGTTFTIRWMDGQPYLEQDEAVTGGNIPEIMSHLRQQGIS
jgi:hypothetical protein